MDKIMKTLEGSDTESVKNFFQKNPDKINQRNSAGETFLMSVCYQGNTDLINLLIDAGANLDMSDKIGRTALHHAVFGRQRDAVAIMIFQGADVNKKNNVGNTPLHWAVKWMVEEWKDGVAALLTPGKNMLQINEQDKHGRTPLHLACFWGHTDTVSLLLNYPGVNVNAVDNYGNTPLHLAVRKQRCEVVSLMLSQDSVKLDLKNCKKLTPLLEAVSKSHLGMIRQLIARGADINAVDGGGNNCLHFAVEKKMFHSEGETLSILDECCTELKLNEGNRLSGVVVAKYLAHQGASFYQKNDKNVTPLDLIKNQGLKEKIQAFLPSKCQWCKDVKASIKFHPCGHIIACERCCSENTFKRCPVCWQQIFSKSRFEGPKLSGKEIQMLAETDECPKFEEKEVQTMAGPVESSKLEEKNLLRVAKNLGSNWWQVGICLGIKTTELEILDDSDPTKQGYLMLYKWFTSCDAEKRTVGTLREALQEAECLTALECLTSDVR